MVTFKRNQVATLERNMWPLWRKKRWPLLEYPPDMTANENLLTQKEKGNTTSSMLSFSQNQSELQQYDEKISFDKFVIKEFSSEELTGSAVVINTTQQTLLLQYCMQGNTNIKQPAQKKNISFKPSEYNILLLKEGEWTLQLNDENCKLIQIYLSEDFFYRYTPNDFTTPIYNLNTIGKLFPKNLYINPKLKSILSEIALCEFGNHLKHLYTKAKIIELLTLQLAQHEEEKLIPATLKPLEAEKMVLVKELIERHINQTHSITSLARAAGTNEQYLKKHFKLLFGNTVFGYITSCKMEKAKELLLSRKYRVTEIAEMVGYKHATHFTSAFKKFFGYLPQTLKTMFGGYFSFAFEFEALEILMMV